MNARELRIYSSTGRYTPEMVNACVQRGIKFLDEHCDDWVNEIDLSRLNLSNPYHCVLGQTGDCIAGPGTGNGYNRVLIQETGEESWQYREAWSTFHGFNIRLPAFSSHDGYQNESKTRWEMLQIAWVTAIKARLEAGS